MHLLPGTVINLFRWLLVTLFLKSCYAYTHSLGTYNLFAGSFLLAKIINKFVHISIVMPTGYKGIYVTLLIGIWLRLFYRIGMYLKKITEPWYILFLERKRIKKLSIRKVFLSSLLFPIFDIVGRYTTYIGLFKKIEWKPVPHNSKITIDDLKDIGK